MFVKKILNDNGPDVCMNIALRYLRLIYADPTTSKNWQFYLFSAYYLTVTMFSYYFIISLFLHMDGNIDTLSNACLTFSSYFQTFITMYPLMVHRKTIGKLIRSRKNFWKSYDAESKEEIGQIFYIAKIALVTSFFLIAITELIFLIKPLFLRELFLPMYIPDFPYAFELLLVIQYFYSPVLSVLVLCMNSTYVAFFIDAIGQFKLLSRRIRNMRNVENGDYMGELKACLQYQTFLMNYISNVQKLFSIPLLGQYLITVGGTCMNLFIIINDFSALSNKILCGSYTCMLNVHFSLYCFVVTSLTVTMEEIPNSFYFSGWEDGTKEFRSCITLCVMKAQKEFVVKAGGMLEIYRGAVTAVFKTSYSFYLIMQNMKEIQK